MISTNKIEVIVPGYHRKAQGEKERKGDLEKLMSTKHTGLHEKGIAMGMVTDAKDHTERGIMATSACVNRI